MTGLDNTSRNAHCYKESTQTGWKMAKAVFNKWLNLQKGWRMAVAVLNHRLRLDWRMVRTPEPQ